MKYINFLFVLVLISSLALFQSCSDDGITQGDNCVDNIYGDWEVDSFTPSSANCSELTTYRVSTGRSKNILSLSIVNGSRTFSGSGFIDDNCSEMSYTVSQDQTIISGDIRFNGSSLEDRSGLGCLVKATKQ